MIGICPFLAGADIGAFIDVPAEVPAARKVREHPATFADHYSQARLFFRSLTPVEQDHVIQAYTFELGKCYEEPIRVRQLQSLANIDSRLAAEVAAGLGLEVPAPDTVVEDAAPSPALSQLGGEWPVAGRVVGIVADGRSDLEALEEVRTALDAAGVVPLVIAPHGGKLGGAVVVQRTYLTARSTEFDAVLVAASGAAAPDAVDSLDAKAGDPEGHPSLDPRLTLLLSEAFRHAKALGAWGAGGSVLEAAGIPTSAPGIVTGTPAQVVTDVTGLLARHRVWERFPTAASGR